MALAAKADNALADRLASLTMPEGAGWARTARSEALARLTSMGLPTRRDEYWRFTRPDALNAAEPAPAATFSAIDSVPLFDAVDRLKLVFVDGVFAPSESDDLALAGVEIAPLAEAMAHDIHWAREVYGVLEARGQTPVARPFAALNSAFAAEGLAIRVTGKAAKPIHLIYRHENTTSDALVHHVVKLEAGADLTLLENGPAAARFNKVLEVEVGEGAAFHHVRAQGRDHERQAVTHLFARLAERSVFKSFTLTVNGRLTRNEIVVEMLGDDAIAHIAGAAMGDASQDGFHHDDTIFVTHDAQRCESRQVFKKVLRNGAVGAFQGKILVKQGAQKTDGYQKSQSLLLDDDSTFLAKPELEIYADDVACSHGSTSGAIDEEALFYLRSRGVPEHIATDLLVLAFLADAIAEIESPEIAADITDRLDAWLRRRRG